MIRAGSYLSNTLCRRRESRRGSALIVVAVTLMVALAIASYSINVVYMEFTRTELQISTDLATRAACRALVDTGSQPEAYRSAQRLTHANPVAGQVLTIGYEDLAFSVAIRTQEGQGYQFAAGSDPNSVHFRSGFFERAKEGLPMLFPTLGVPIAFRPIKEASATQAELDIAIVLDCSSSMLASLYENSPPEGLLELPLLTPVPLNARWRLARSGINEVLNEFSESPQHELVSITAFNTAVLFNLALSDFYLPIREFLAFQEFVYLGGLSDLSGGLNKALDHHSDKLQARPWASRVILLISDGKGNLGTNPFNVAKAAAASNVMLYTISIAEEANQTSLEQLAASANGKHFHAKTADDFRTIAQSITRRLPILITK